MADEELGASLDVNRMRFEQPSLQSMEPAARKAFAAMAELEKGGIANPDEKRIVGHYWLRVPGHEGPTLDIDVLGGETSPPAWPAS